MHCHNVMDHRFRIVVGCGCVSLFALVCVSVCVCARVCVYAAAGVLEGFGLAGVRCASLDLGSWGVLAWAARLGCGLRQACFPSG